MIKARINGIDCIVFYEERIPQGKAPSGYPFKYLLRHDENDWTRPISLERFVAVNFFGTAFMRKPIKLDIDGYIEIVRFDLKYNFVKLIVSGTLFRKLFGI
jgi:hypothetical protein